MPARKLRAFTLIELLVVVAIISILAAILFPVFARARESARSVQCMNNMRNLSAAVLLYAADYDDRMPLAARLANTPTGFVTWHNILDSHAGSTDIWFCPSSSVARQDASGALTAHYGYNVLYMTNIRLDFGNVTSHAGIGLHQITRPADTVLFADASASVPNSWCGDDGKFMLPPSQPSVDCWGRPNYLHHQRANVIFTDGHARTRAGGDFYEGQRPPDLYFDLD